MREEGETVPISVLLVDDNPLDRELTLLGIRRLSREINFSEAESAADALERIADRAYDCVVSDYQMPGASGLDLLNSLRSGGESIPFIFLTGQGNEAIASEALRRGANDYFTKDVGFAHYDRLLNTIRRLVDHERARAEKARAEAQIRESEERLRQIIEQMPFPVHIFDPDGTSRMVNPAFLRLLGITSAAAVIGSFNALRDLALEELGIKEMMVRAFRGESPETQIVQLHPRIFYGLSGTAGDAAQICEFTIFPVKNSTLRISQVVLIINNITDTVFAQNALAASEEQYRHLFEELWSGMAHHEIVYDEDGRAIDYRFLAINPAFQRFTGLNPDDLIGKTVREVLPQTEDHWIQRLARVAETGKPEHFVEYAQEFDKFYEVRVFATEPGKCAAMFHDVTAVKRAEIALHEGEARLRGIFNTMPTSVLYLVDNLVREANDRWCDMLGYDHDELPGKPAGICFQDVASFERELERFQLRWGSEDANSPLESRLRHKDGAVIAVRLTITPVHAGEPDKGLVLTAHVRK